MSIVSGAFLGITNTLMTQVVMESAPVPRPIASSAYSFVRFCGGAIAPFVAGKLAEHVSVQAPFYLGAGMTAIGVGVLWIYRGALQPASPGQPQRLRASEQLAAPAADPRGAGPMVDRRRRARRARQVSAIAVPLARAAAPRSTSCTSSRQTCSRARTPPTSRRGRKRRRLLDACIAELREAGVPVTGELLHSYGTHTDVARADPAPRRRPTTPARSCSGPTPARRL